MRPSYSERHPIQRSPNWKEIDGEANKLEQIQENNVEHLQHVHQLLQKKFNDHRRYKQLYIQHATLKVQLEELQDDHKRVQTDLKEEEK